MAKKHKKFKKKIGQNLSQRIAEIEQTENQSPESNQKNTEPTKNQVTVDFAEDKYAYVKKDIRRDLLIILSLIVVLVVIYLVNIKTGYLKVVADWVYNLLNLKI